MSGDTITQIPSTLPHWGILMRSFLRDGQPLGRAVAEKAKALMDRWKAMFQSNMGVLKPVQIKQLGPPPEQPKGALLRSVAPAEHNTGSDRTDSENELRRRVGGAVGDACTMQWTYRLSPLMHLRRKPHCSLSSDRRSASESNVRSTPVPIFATQIGQDLFRSVCTRYRV